jgi:hypothetical protein
LETFCRPRLEAALALIESSLYVLFIGWCNAFGGIPLSAHKMGGFTFHSEHPHCPGNCGMVRWQARDVV